MLRAPFATFPALLAACLRYVPAIIAAQIVGLIAVAAMGALIGYGWKQAILYIGLPAMGGGIAAGAARDRHFRERRRP